MRIRSIAVATLLVGCATPRDPEKVATPPAASVATPAPAPAPDPSTPPTSAPPAESAAPAASAKPARGSLSGAWHGRAARFDAMSLTLKASDGRLTGDGLIRSDTSKVTVKIEGTVTGDAVTFTLKVPKSPSLGYYDGAKFSGRFDGEQLAGELVLVGDPSKRPLTFTRDEG
jgi:hypothetical protein